MRFQGVVYRAHNPLWSWEPLSGEGARRHGGRFNRLGIAALYTSLSSHRSPRSTAAPLTLCACEVDAEPVFDALGEETCQTLNVGWHDLAGPGWEAGMLDGAIPASQALADRLVAAGYVGMRVQSFLPPAQMSMTPIL